MDRVLGGVLEVGVLGLAKRRGLTHCITHNKFLHQCVNTPGPSGPEKQWCTRPLSEPLLGPDVFFFKPIPRGQLYLEPIRALVELRLL